MAGCHGKSLFSPELINALDQQKPPDGVVQPILSHQCSKNCRPEGHHRLAVGVADEVKTASNQNVSSGLFSGIRHVGGLPVEHWNFDSDQRRSHCLRRHAEPEQLSHA